MQREKKRTEKKRRAAKRRKGQKKERKRGRGDRTDSTEVAAPRGDAGRIARFSDHGQTHTTKKDISVHCF